MEVFKNLMTKKSDKELEDYLVNIMTYNRDIIEAAIAELKNRGREFTELELAALELKIQERENTVGKNTITVRNDWEKEIVENENAVSLYSRKTIDWSTIIFSVIVGSILMTINLIKTDKKKGILPLILFAIIYIIIEGNILFYVESKDHGLVTLSRILLNGISALVVHTLFWNLFIGKNYKYKKEKIWLPIVLGVLINGLFLIAML